MKVRGQDNGRAWGTCGEVSVGLVPYQVGKGEGFPGLALGSQIGGVGGRLGA